VPSRVMGKREIVVPDEPPAPVLEIVEKPPAQAGWKHNCVNCIHRVAQETDGGDSENTCVYWYKPIEDIYAENDCAEFQRLKCGECVYFDEQDQTCTWSKDKIKTSPDCECQFDMAEFS